MWLNKRTQDSIFVKDTIEKTNDESDVIEKNNSKFLLLKNTIKFNDESEVVQQKNLRF